MPLGSFYPQKLLKGRTAGTDMHVEHSSTMKNMLAREIMSAVQQGVVICDYTMLQTVLYVLPAQTIKMYIIRMGRYQYCSVCASTSFFTSYAYLWQLLQSFGESLITLFCCLMSSVVTNMVKMGLISMELQMCHWVKQMKEVLGGLLNLFNS